MTTISWTIYILAWIDYLLPLVAYTTCVVDGALQCRQLVVRYLAEIRTSRVAKSNSLYRPGRPQACVLTTA